MNGHTDFFIAETNFVSISSLEEIVLTSYQFKDYTLPPRKSKSVCWGGGKWNCFCSQSHLKVINGTPFLSLK